MIKQELHSELKNKGKEKCADHYQHLHHWWLECDGAKSGSGFNWWAKNQMWNLKPMPDPQIHSLLHGGSRNPSGMLKSFWYGTPHWFKTGTFSTSGHIYDITSNP